MIDWSNVTEIGSSTDEVIEAVPVFDDEQPARAGGVVALDKECGVTDEMRAWAAANISSDIDVEHATNVFFNYFENEPKRLTLSQWKVWMLRERPKRDYSSRSMTPSERRTAILKARQGKDLFADVTD